MRVFLIVLDGVGMGALPDAGRYGDAGANTLLHVADSVGRLALPVMETLGLGNLLPMPGVRPSPAPIAPRGPLTDNSPCKDSTPGHWEMMGLVLEQPFPTYPDGFPRELLDRWSERIERHWIGNLAASGTAIKAREE